MTWFMGLAGLLFILMIVSPVWFFRQIDNLLSEEEDKYKVIDTYQTQAVCEPTSSQEELEQEMKRFELLQHAYENCQSIEFKRIWYNKQQQYRNLLRWRRLEEHASGKHTPIQY